MSKKSSFNLTASSSNHTARSFPKSKAARSSIREYQKKIKNYFISYCPGNMLGISLFGEIRQGHNQQESKVFAIRINTLPITSFVRHNLQLQKEMSKIRDCAAEFVQSIDTQTKRYTIMEFFPKTLKNQIQAFQKSSKLLYQFLQKFLAVYAKLYYLRIVHGNLVPENIGITFDGKVKLMDFRSTTLTFEEGILKDYNDFKIMMCTLMERESVFPEKLACLDEENGSWQKLFSLWHIVHPYQYIYVHKKNQYQNRIVLLHKLQVSIQQCLQQNFEHLQIAIRLLIFEILLKMYGMHTEKAKPQIQCLRKILSPIYDSPTFQKQRYISYYNSILWGIIQDPYYYGLTQTHKLALVSCFFQQINHEYLYTQILELFKENKMYIQRQGKQQKFLKPDQLDIIRNNQMHEILAKRLLMHYSDRIKNQMLRIQSMEDIDKICQIQIRSSRLKTKQSILQTSRSLKFKRTCDSFSGNLRGQFSKNRDLKKFSFHKSSFTPSFPYLHKNHSLNQSKNTQESSYRQ